MPEVTLEFIAEQLKRVLDEQASMRDEQRAMRNEMRRMAENQLDTTRSVRALRDDLELMIRTEVGGLFAHLETRLEARIAEQLQVRS